MSEGGNRGRQAQAARLRLVRELQLLRSRELQRREDFSVELLRYCQSDSLSERGLRELFAQHGLKPGNHNRLNNYDFFYEACDNERVTEGIIRPLLEYFPDAVSTGEDGWRSLYYACENKNVTLNIVRLIVEAAPDHSLRILHHEDGRTLLHHLCGNDQVDKAAALEILNLLIEKYPEAVRHTDDFGNLPIHLANMSRNHELYRVLIEAYPGSVSVPDAGGILPLHNACWNGSLATVEYMYDLYPDAIIHASTQGHYPIHLAIASVKCRENPAIAAEIVPFLLNCDPNQKLIQLRGKSLLRYACQIMRYGSNIETAIQVIGCLFDAHPEAIEDDEFAADTNRYHPHVQSFINNELVYARQANDHRLMMMMTPDDNGQLPLHTALQNNVRLGSIKLLVNGNPSAVRAVDRQGNTALHYACRRAKHDMIALLLAKSFVSRRNAHDKLPIHLLWESNQVSDRESLEYMECVFRLLRADPEMINH